MIPAGRTRRRSSDRGTRQMTCGNRGRRGVNGSQVGPPLPQKKHRDLYDIWSPETIQPGVHFSKKVPELDPAPQPLSHGIATSAWGSWRALALAQLRSDGCRSVPAAARHRLRRQPSANLAPGENDPGASAGCGCLCHRTLRSPDRRSESKRPVDVANPTWYVLPPITWGWRR